MIKLYRLRNNIDIASINFFSIQILNMCIFYFQLLFNLNRWRFGPLFEVRIYFSANSNELNHCCTKGQQKLPIKLV